MAEIKIGIPKKEEVPEKVQVPVVQPTEKTQQVPAKPAIVTTNINDRAIASMIEAIKTSPEATEKITGMIMASLDISRFKERLIEEALRDVQLRNKIMLELLKKL